MQFLLGSVVGAFLAMMILGLWCRFAAGTGEEPPEHRGAQRGAGTPLFAHPYGLALKVMSDAGEDRFCAPDASVHTDQH